MRRANPYSGLVDGLSAGELEQLNDAVRERMLREETGFGTLAEAAELYRPAPPCPSCREEAPWGDGLSEAGAQRWRCPSCGARFSSLTGTVLERCKKPLATWADFIRLTLFAVPLDACAEMCRISHQTAWEWRHRLFAAVDGYQDRIVLRGRVWVDETYIDDTDLSKGYGQARKRGLSKQKPCIAVAIDARKEPVAVVCGHGKPSTKRVKGALGGHLAKGVTVVHDREKAHNGMIRDAGCESESYKADVRDPVYLERMALVNPLLVDQALPVAVHGHGPGNPAVLPQPLRVSVPGQAGRREVAQAGKGGPPSAHDRPAFPQLDVTDPSPVSLTVRFCVSGAARGGCPRA